MQNGDLSSDSKGDWLWMVSCLYLYSNFLLKRVVYNCNPIHFLSNSENTSSQSTLCSVCVLKKKSGVHTQPWLCKQETNRVAWVEPPTQDVKYQHFSHISTKHFVWYVTTRAPTQDRLMLCVTCASLKEHWREGCICLAVEFKYQQGFSRIIDYTFKHESTSQCLTFTHSHTPIVVELPCKALAWPSNLFSVLLKDVSDRDLALDKQ